MNFVYKTHRALMLFLEFEKYLSLIQNFKGQKSTGFEKILFEKRSLYLLGHLRANNQRSGKNLSLIRNFTGVKFNRFANFLKIFLQRKRHLLVRQVSVEQYRYSVAVVWAVLLKKGALTPWLQCAPDRLFVKQRNQIVRRIYDLGRVVKLIFIEV